MDFARFQVVGPGALGSPFAAFLALFRPTGVEGRRGRPTQGAAAGSARGDLGGAAPFRFRFHPSSGSEPVDAEIPAPAGRCAPPDGAAGTALFVTLPPARAVDGALESLDRHLDAASLSRGGREGGGGVGGGGPPPVVVVFGNNGLLPHDLAHTVASRARGVEIPCLRAIFYTGFLREGSEVRHTGGSRVLLGPIGSSSGAARACDALLSVFAGPGREGAPPGSPAFRDIFAFERSADVRRAEWVKFFVNAMLALGTGPRALPNGALFDRLAPARLDAWARAFHASSGVDPGELTAALRATVASTAANVNSVSLAASRGEVETFACFVETLARECVADGRPPPGGHGAAAGFVPVELARARAEWGLPTQ